MENRESKGKKMGNRECKENGRLKKKTEYLNWNRKWETGWNENRKRRIRLGRKTGRGCESEKENGNGNFIENGSGTLGEINLRNRENLKQNR